MTINPFVRQTDSGKSKSSESVFVSQELEKLKKMNFCEIYNRYKELAQLYNVSPALQTISEKPENKFDEILEMLGALFEFLFLQNFSTDGLFLNDATKLADSHKFSLVALFAHHEKNLKDLDYSLFFSFSYTYLSWICKKLAAVLMSWKDVAPIDYESKKEIKRWLQLLQDVAAKVAKEKLSDKELEKLQELSKLINDFKNKTFTDLEEF